MASEIAKRIQELTHYGGCPVGVIENALSPMLRVAEAAEVVYKDFQYHEIQYESLRDLWNAYKAYRDSQQPKAETCELCHGDGTIRNEYRTRDVLCPHVLALLAKLESKA